MKTKTTILVTTIATLITCSVYGEDALIPLKSQILLQKLQKWESEEKAKFDAMVNKKKQVVAGVLKTHLTEVTKQGDLKGANALQAQITKLTGEKAIVADSDTTPSDGEDDGYKLTIENPTDQQLIDFFKNTTWELYRSSSPIKIIRFDDIKSGALVNVAGKEYSNMWKVENGKVIRWDHNADKWLSLDFNAKRNTIEFEEGLVGVFRKVRSKK